MEWISNHLLEIIAFIGTITGSIYMFLKKVTKIELNLSNLAIQLEEHRIGMAKTLSDYRIAAERDLSDHKINLAKDLNMHQYQFTKDLKAHQENDEHNMESIVDALRIITQDIKDLLKR